MTSIDLAIWSAATRRRFEFWRRRRLERERQKSKSGDKSPQSTSTAVLLFLPRPAQWRLQLLLGNLGPGSPRVLLHDAVEIDLRPLGKFADRAFRFKGIRCFQHPFLAAFILKALAPLEGGDHRVVAFQ